jgi:telomere length regulation protein
MLVAEIVSSRSVLEGSGLTVLSFGDIWDAEGREYEVIRELRDMVQEKPATEEGWEGILRSTFAPTSTLVPLAKPIMRAAPAIVAAPVVPPKTPLISIIPDPSDLQPYPLPAPPSTSYLETLSSADASLYSTALPSTSSSTTRKMGKLRSPVYIPELVDYLKGKSVDAVEEGGEEESERVEVGLREGAALIRRKVGWGMELGESLESNQQAAVLTQFLSRGECG